MNIKYLIPLMFLILLAMPTYAYTIRTNFYDENTLSAIPTVTITDANGSVYTSDANGLWTASLTGAKSFEISKAGYDTRPFEFYFKEDANYNFLLSPTGTDSEIEFLVKDTNNNLWNNKYLMFQQDKSINIKTYSGMVQGSGAFSSEIGFIRALKNIKLESITFTSGQNKTTAIEIKITGGATICTIPSATYAANTQYTKNFTNCYLTASTNYDIYNLDVPRAGSGWTSDGYLTGNTVSTYNFAGYTGQLANIKYSIINSDNNNIINSLLTSSQGYATANILPAGDYNALLYNATGDLNYTYAKTTVTANKPKDEITLVDISPYDVEVGGLLSYDLENQTDASIAFNVFAGTVNYYDITVVDYNATPADRLYIPRRYQVIVPMGTDYVQAYTVQPYLLAILDGVSPSVYTVDTFSRALSDIRVDVLKYMGGSLVLVESLFSDSVGKVNFSGYPLQTYYFKTYYNNTLMTTTSYVPTASTVPHYIIIDTIGQTAYVPSGNIMVDFSDTAESVGYNENLTANITVYSTLYANIVDVTIAWYDGATLLDSEVYNTPFTTNHVDITKLLTNPLSISKDTATTKIKVTVRYLDNGTTYSAYFYKIININSDPTIPTVFESMKTIGASSRLLTLFLSILITIALLFVIIRSGVVSSPNVITIIGLLILGFFVYVGWISTGVKIFGTDPLVFIYSIGVIIAIYFLSINQGN